MEASSDFEDEFKKFLDETIEWFRKRATRNQWAYNISRFALVASSAALPALISNNLTTLATMLSVIVAIIAGLDAQFKPGEQWKNHRSTQMNLLSVRRDYEYNISKHAGVGVENGENLFDLLYGSVKEILRKQSDSFWQSRIIDWQQPRK